VIAGALIDEFAKEHRHDHLRWVRNALAGQMVGASRRELPGPGIPFGHTGRPVPKLAIDLAVT